jgi:hypothetical protein
MARFKEGDRVRVKGRHASEQEVLEGRYAPFMAGATGTILKIYDSNQIAVNLDIASLPEEVRQRHAEQQETMHRRWLDSLSEEARNRLTDQEKAFHLNYVVLLTESDLEPFGGRPARRAQTAPANLRRQAKRAAREGSRRPLHLKRPKRQRGNRQLPHPNLRPRRERAASEGRRKLHRQHLPAPPRSSSI